MTTPRLWIVGGPNGSGKSTLIRKGGLHPWTGPSLKALSPDDIVLDLRKAHPDRGELELLREAQERSDRQVDEAIAARRSVMVETVLSSAKFELPVLRALRAGFELGFAFVTVASADLNTHRVGQRVAHGGHDVPADRIRSRRERSHTAFTWFAGRATIGVLFDNSFAAPRLLAEKRPDDPAWTVYDPDSMQRLQLRLPG